jgi:hypothetical protein
MSKVEDKIDPDTPQKVTERFSFSSLKDSIKASISNLPSLPKKNGSGRSRRRSSTVGETLIKTRQSLQSFIDGAKERRRSVIGTSTTVIKSEKQSNEPDEKLPGVFKDTKDLKLSRSNTTDAPMRKKEVRKELSDPKTPYQLTDFTIIKLVGKGGFAKVYKVIENKKNVVYALKVMRKDNVRKMKQVK